MTYVLQIRPFEHAFLAVDLRRLDEIPEWIVELMGYKIQTPFTGYGELCRAPSALNAAEKSTVDGLNPRDGARRMVNWSQRPLDPSPAFAKL